MTEVKSATTTNSINGGNSINAPKFNGCVYDALHEAHGLLLNTSQTIRRTLCKKESLNLSILVFNEENQILVNTQKLIPFHPIMSSNDKDFVDTFNIRHDALHWAVAVAKDWEVAFAHSDNMSTQPDFFTSEAWYSDKSDHVFANGAVGRFQRGFLAAVLALKRGLDLSCFGIMQDTVYAVAGSKTLLFMQFMSKEVCEAHKEIFKEHR